MGKINDAEALKGKNIMLQGKTLGALIESKLTGLIETRRFVRSFGFFSSDISEDACFMKQILCTPSIYAVYVASLEAKEKEPKTSPSFVNIKPDKTLECATTLPDIISNEQLLEIVNPTYRDNYEISGIPMAEYDPTTKTGTVVVRVKELAGTVLEAETSSRECEIKYKVNDETNTLNIVSTYNSPTTNKIAKKVVSSMAKTLKEQEYTATNARVEKILFSSFSNRNRTIFMLSLRAPFCDIADFGQVTNIDVDTTNTEELANDEQFEWASGEVTKMALAGFNMNKIPSLIQTNYYNNFLIKEITIDYKTPKSKRYESIRCIFTFKSAEHLRANSEAVFSYSPSFNQLPNTERSVIEEGMIKEYITNHVIRLYHQYMT